MRLTDLSPGDIISLDCPNLTKNLRSQNPITGEVLQVFDKLFKDGSEGNLEIDILFSGKWVRYIPSVDGGNLTILKRK